VDLEAIPKMEEEEFIENEDAIGDYNMGEILGEGQFASVKSCR
jgi:hypothetical protein